MDLDLYVEGGTVLAASPDLMDPNFMHRVVLMAQHTAEGAYGLVLAQASDQTTRTVFPEHPTLSTVDFPVHLGGPVELNALQIVHRAPAAIPGGIPLLRGVFLGGDLDAVGEYLQAEPRAALEHVRLIVGYSGWGPGQLEEELVSGSWLPATVAPGDVFVADPEVLWRRVLRSLGEGMQDLENQPPDPSWN